MNWHNVITIARKDIKEVRENKSIWIPMIVVFLIFSVVLPVIFILAILHTAESELMTEPMKTFFQNMPTSLTNQIAGMTLEQQMIYLAVTYFFAPLFLILPLMVSNIFAVDSFAGEKERKTIEALLYTPTTDKELIMGKLLAAFVPSQIIAWIGFVIYSIVVNLTGYPTFGRIFFPGLLWVVLMLWIVPAVSLFGLGVSVLVSIKAKSFQEAYQISGTVVLPFVAILLMQIFGVIYLSIWFTLVLGLLFWVVDWIILYIGTKRFRRGEIIANMV